MYPSYEKGGATMNLINFINFVKKNINIYLISNINIKKSKKIFSKNIKIINFLIFLRIDI